MSISFKFVILHFTFYCFAAKGEDVALECPQRWRNGCKVSLYCSLKTANFTSTVCTGLFLEKAEFQLKGNGAKLASPECAVDFSASCDGTFSQEGCACTSLIRNVYTFQHKLVVTSKLANASWFCEPQCFNAGLDLGLLTSRSDTCSNTDVIDFILEWRGIVLLCVGTALVIAGIIMISAAGFGIAGKVGIALGGVGYILLIAGSALMTVAYSDDEPAGIAFVWVGSLLLISLGIGISITGDPGGTQQKPDKADPASEEGGTELQRRPGDNRDRDNNHTHLTQKDAVKHSAANNKEVPRPKCGLSALAKVGIGFMWVGGTLAIIGGIVAATEQCPSGDFPTTLQEIRGLILAVIGFGLFLVGIIIEIVKVALIKKETEPDNREGTSTPG